jgi:hypothetical protein
VNTRQKSIVVGAILGAALGALAGFLFTRGLDIPREDEEPQGLSLRSVPPGEMVKVFIGILGVLRGVAELGERI